MRTLALVTVVAMLATAGCAAAAPASVLERAEQTDTVLDLPPPTTIGTTSLEEVLVARRSGRRFQAEPLPLASVGQLFWAAQGITDDAGHRTAPSAGARYPLELYAITDQEIMHYLPDGHRVEIRPTTDPTIEFGSVAFDQDWIDDAPIIFVISGVVARTEVEYGAVAATLMDREAGHAAQNLLLEATALGLAAVPVGGFDPAEIKRLLLLAPGEEVLYLMPVGHPA